MDLTQYTPETWMQNEEILMHELKKSSWKSFPLLNQVALESLKDGQIVRFVGMVQDFLDPEYYIESYINTNNETNERIIKSGKYMEFFQSKDFENVDFYSKDTIKKELVSVHVISTPAENQWVKDIERNENVPTMEQTFVTNFQKRTLEEACTPSNSNNQGNSNKKHCSTPFCTSEQSNIDMSTDYIHNLSMKDKNNKVFIVKVYGNESETIELNQIYEFIGFLSVNSILSQASCSLHDSFETNLEVQQILNTEPVFPRIHSLCHKLITNSNPLVNCVDNGNFKFVEIRNELMILLTQLLLGDEIAAEYLLCHLISEVYIRKDFMALGKFSLNVSNIPVLENFDYVRKLYEFIQLLLPKSHYLPLTIENLNKITFIPKKNYDTDRIDSGLLQLSPNTNLVLDETKMNPGKLDNNGVIAINALKKVIKTQTISYDFTYYPIEYNCDIPCLITSEYKSMLPSDCHIILKPEDSHINTVNEVFEAAKHFLRPGLLNEIRKYLTLVRMIPYNLGDYAVTLIENKFVEMRQEGGCADDLHNLIVLFRLMGLSYGKNTLDQDSWNIVSKLEDLRKQRLTN